MEDKKQLIIVLIDCSDRTIASNAILRAKELSKKFEVTLISNIFFNNAHDKITRLKVELGNFHWLRRFGHIAREIVFSYQVRKKLRSLPGKPDFLICHGHSAAYFVGRYFQKKAVPYALFMHGDIFDRPWKTYGLLLTLFYRAITPAAARDADLVICQSPQQTQMAERHGPLHGKTIIIPNGINSSKVGLKPSQHNKNILDFKEKDRLKILFVGNFSPEKGVDILIEACGKLFNEGIPFQLTLIGPNENDPTLIHLISKTKCKERFILAGRLDRKLLAEFYCNTHVLCVPSRSEPLANVILEALICGTPVIASDIGGNPFMVTDEVNGWLFESESVTGLAQILKNIAQNPEKLRDVASKCIPSVESRFSWKSVGKRFADEINNILHI